MKKLLITTMLFLSCTWAIAQQRNDPSSQEGEKKVSTVQGCLSKSGSDYTLTDKSGTIYRLVGATSNLNDHVGHEVQVKGVKTAPTAVSEAASSNSGSPQYKLNVTDMKHISSTCSSSSDMRNPSSDKSKSDKPMSEKPPQL